MQNSLRSVKELTGLEDVSFSLRETSQTIFWKKKCNNERKRAEFSAVFGFIYMLKNEYF